MAKLEYTHVDVFSCTAYGGNSLPVFTDARGLNAEQMLRITKEMRHFEAVFLEPSVQPHRVRVRVFDLFEELPFAGHPIIGAAAVVHHTSNHKNTQNLQVELISKTVTITTERTPTGYFGLLDQGTPEFFGTVDLPETFARAFSLEQGDLHSDLPLEVVSTGLRYLIMPVKPGALERAHISNDVTELLRSVKAQFAVLFDEAGAEVRHWNNDGIIEDVATGSAAGVIGAYRLRHGLAKSGATFTLNQGRFTGRPSNLRVQVEGESHRITNVKVGGDVSLVGRGTLEVLP
jgi:trans-2,3-dihydro-3-hydroxyanthranilate isomerase